MTCQATTAVACFMLVISEGCSPRPHAMTPLTVAPGDGANNFQHLFKQSVDTVSNCGYSILMVNGRTTVVGPAEVDISIVPQRVGVLFANWGPIPGFYLNASSVLWCPALEDVVGAEDALATLVSSLESLRLPQQLDSYVRQYVAISDRGKRKIWGQFVCPNALYPGEHGAYHPNLFRQVALVYGQTDCIITFLYDVENDMLEFVAFGRSGTLRGEPVQSVSVPEEQALE